ncbi:meiotic recombination protein SPO11 isoform X1 [Tanacetum coccineum]
MYNSGSSSSAKAAADFEQGADSEPSCHIGVRGMDSEPSSNMHKKPAAKNPSAKKQRRKRVKSVGCSSSDGAHSAFVETTGHCSSDSAPSTPVEMMGHASSDSAPSTPVEMMGHASSDSAPSTPVEMMGHSSSDSAPSAPIEMKGHSSSDGDDSSSYESDFHDSEADNELEEDPGSMFDAEPGAELVEPESSEAESDASTRIEIIWHNLSTLKGKFKMGEIPDDVLYGKEVDGQQLKSKIHELFSEVGASVLKDGVHYFKFPWNKTVFDSTLGYYVKKKASKSRSATMLSRQSSLFVCLLSHILNLIQDGTKATPDEAKYWDETLYVKVEDVKAAVDAICMRFECVRSSLRIISVSKGIVVGPLSYRVKDTWISCESLQFIPSEEAIPEDFESEARFILIVEKDTVFHRLENPNFNFCQRYRCIMVTAKGQPNVSTRMFVQSLRRNLQIPVFVLVDCNPSGFIIMSAYRHGAETRAFENHRMAVPDLKWIGLHPTEVEKYNISNYGVPLTKQDVYNCKRLLKKQCVNDVPDFKRQLEHMLETNRKYQIEALGTSETSLTRYLLEKLEIKDWI